MSARCQVSKCCGLAAPPSAFCSIHESWRLVPCSQCSATGYDPHYAIPPYSEDDEPCGMCHGTGERWLPRAQAEAQLAAANRATEKRLAAKKPSP